MSSSGGVDQQFICCSQCHGLFTRRKTLLHHKSICNGNPESSKCDFYAVPFSEYKAWKKDHNQQKSKLKNASKVEEESMIIEDSNGFDDDTSPSQYSSTKTKEEKGEPPLKTPRRRGRPRKIIPSMETTESSSTSIKGARDDEKSTEETKQTENNSPVDNTYIREKIKSLPNSPVATQSPKSANPASNDNSVKGKTKTSSSTPAQKEISVEIPVKTHGTSANSKIPKSPPGSNSFDKNTEDDDVDESIALNETSETDSTSKLVKVPWEAEAEMEDDHESVIVLSPEDVILAGDVENVAEKENIKLEENGTEDEGTESSDHEESKTSTTDKEKGSFDESFSMAVEMKHHEYGPVFQCSICEYKTRLKGMYVRHMQSHNFGDRFNCDVCGRIFIHRRHFNAHMMTHNRLQCPHCDKRYSRTHDRDRHVKNVHSDEKLMFSCSTCDFSTSYQGNFKEHLRKHTGERLFCTEPGCEYKTLYRRALRHHQNSVHATTKDFKCQWCSYASSTKLGLTKHMVTHSSIRDKKCPHCEYTAKTTGSLRAHIMKHGSEKYYFCDQCSYKTFRAHSFRNHMLIHLGLKPWFCATCNFDAVTREKVVRHIVAKHGPISKNRPQVRKKDIRVKLNLEAFKRDPSVPDEENDQSNLDNSKMVMIEVINESGENVQANFSRRHKVILKDPNNTEEVMGQSISSDLPEQEGGDIYKCAMCTYQADNLGEVEDHINECHGSMTDEEIVMNFEGSTIEASQFDISQANIEIQEATEQEVEEMVYVIASDSIEEPSLVVQSKSEGIQDDAVFTAVESILHLKNAPEIINATVASNSDVQEISNDTDT